MSTLPSLGKLDLNNGKDKTEFKKLSLFSYLGDGIVWILLIVMALIEFLPISWLFSNSLRDPRVAYNLPPSFFPTDFQWQNYWNVIKSPDINFMLFFWNSIKITGLVTFGTLLTCSLAAFAFAKLNFPGKNSLFFMFLATMMVPGTVVMVPTFITHQPPGFDRLALGVDFARADLRLWHLFTAPTIYGAA